MPLIETIGVFALASFILIAVPGPSVLFVVSRGVSLGRRAALLTVIGNTGGLYTQVLLVAVGLGALVEQSAVVYGTVKFGGAAYLIYLGISTLRNHRPLAEALDLTSEPKPHTSLIRDGFIVGLANPKTIVFLSAFLTQFINPVGSPAATQIATLGLLFAAIALISDGAWGLFAGTARAWLARSPRRLGLLGKGSGFVMLALGLRLAISGRQN